MSRGDTLPRARVTRSSSAFFLTKRIERTEQTLTQLTGLGLNRERGGARKRKRRETGINYGSKWTDPEEQAKLPTSLSFFFLPSFFLSRVFQRRSGWSLPGFYERSGKKRSRGKTRSPGRRYDSVSSYETERNKSRRFARTLRDYTYARRSCRSGVSALFFQPGLFCFTYRSKRVFNDREEDIREINPGCFPLFYYECTEAIFEASGVWKFSIAFRLLGE